MSLLSLIFVRTPVANPVFPFFLKPISREKENLIPWGFCTCAFFEAEVFEDIDIPITQGECMGVRGICLHFAGRRLSCLLCHPLLSLSLSQRVGIKTQLLLPGSF